MAARSPLGRYAAMPGLLVRQKCPLSLRDNHFGRRIIGLDTNYYVISRRYICGECESNSKQAKKAAMPAPESAGLIVLGDVDDAADVEQHTFTGWDERSRPLLPHGLGSHFPVFLT